MLESRISWPEPVEEIAASSLLEPEGRLAVPVFRVPEHAGTIGEDDKGGAYEAM